MKIAQIAPFEESVPPKKYGGTELVVYNLTEELTRRGHCVTLFASGDSRVSCRLVPIFPQALRFTKPGSDPQQREAFKFLGIAQLVSLLLKERFDIIHNHIGWRLLPFIPLFKGKALTTLHGPLDIGYQRVIYQKFARLNYVSISKNQREPAPWLNFAANVYNGIDLKTFPFNQKPKDYLVFLGRMSPEKGPLQAIQIAKMSGKNLLMAAKVDIVDQNYFTQKIKPLIDNKQIKFLGEVDNKRKIELLKNAKALIAPIQWREPFGLFFAEAMACGTPVITFKRGSTAEVIKNNKTGFVVNNVSSAVQAIKKISQIKRQDCRVWVEKNFSVKKMTDGYEQAYQKISGLDK